LTCLEDQAKMRRVGKTANHNVLFAGMMKIAGLFSVAQTRTVAVFWRI
jgi:hypothetical protein